MLEPPEKDVGVVVVEEPPENRRALVEDDLPGAAASLHEPPFLHCVAVAADDDDRRCRAPLARGGRCKRVRQRGNYCKQHFLEWSGEDKKKLVLDCWADNLGDAAVPLVTAWEGRAFSVLASGKVHGPSNGVLTLFVVHQVFRGPSLPVLLHLNPSFRAEDSWEQTMLDMACKASLEERVQETKDVKDCRRKVSALLEPLGLERLDTPDPG